MATNKHYSIFLLALALVLSHRRCALPTVLVDGFPCDSRVLTRIERFSACESDRSKYLPKRTSSNPAQPPRLNQVLIGKLTTTLKMRGTNPPAFTRVPLLPCFAPFTLLQLPCAPCAPCGPSAPCAPCGTLKEQRGRGELGNSL